MDEKTEPVEEVQDEEGLDELESYAKEKKPLLRYPAGEGPLFRGLKQWRSIL